MLLRSASTPILKSCTYQSDLGLRFPITRPVSMSLSSSSSSPIENSTMKISRTTSETNLRQQKKRNVSQRSVTSSTVVEEEEEVGLCSGRRLMRSSGLDEGCSVGAEHSVIVGGGGVGTGGGGNGGSGGGGGRDGSESMDEYYQKMIRAYPCDALLLGNYAKFLKEVRGDVVKAEEYYERAILAQPNDGNVLSHYGDLIWNSHSDGPRAQTYFDQALQASPDDCYVLASYAKFLWEAGEEEENGISCTGKCISPSNLPQGCSPTLPLAAAP